jgi:hypothetical protein
MPKVMLTKNNLEYSYLLGWGTQGANNARDKWQGGVAGMYGVNTSHPFLFPICFVWMVGALEHNLWPTLGFWVCFSWDLLESSLFVLSCPLCWVLYFKEFARFHHLVSSASLTHDIYWQHVSKYCGCSQRGPCICGLLGSI